ncbi:MAG: hypothetical protein Q4G24_08700 [Paracoccus sp. (in: a-proteobacteria)]|uniref:hypothetical protein n=1 Tax=Paracoccus sp. TaxID=267 RepID=UPI0026E01EFA|nr:hypothetical protein [Paracoccus sp. (in: a-proteobacteria)]MDO5621533.1 hypothetical protein [Paracoccus sp. (in: a-proteobacteria)]
MTDPEEHKTLRPLVQRFKVILWTTCKDHIESYGRLNDPRIWLCGLLVVSLFLGISALIIELNLWLR